ncbi:hypothetical protein Droror1_Dr00019228 [Drosera rotundifolia]
MDHLHLIILVAFSTMMITLVIIVERVMVRLRPRCKCDICKSYLSRSWTQKFNNMSDWYAHLLRQSPTSTIHIHVMSNTITANPDNVEHMLKTNFDNYPKGSPFSAILGDFLGRGIFVADGDNWRFQRKIASLELGSVSIRTFSYEILSYEISSRLVPLMTAAAASSSSVKLDLQDVFRRFSFDNICRFSFGIDPGCLRLSLPMSELAEAFDLASKLSAERALVVSPWLWKLKRVLNLGSEKMLRDAIAKIDVLAGDIIQQRKKMGFSSKRDLLSRFMNIMPDDEEYLRDIVVSFLLAGRDTVASALTMFFYLVSENPEVEARIREEADRVLGRADPVGEDIKPPIRKEMDRASTTGPDNRVPGIEKLKELVYLHATIYESLRLFPPVQNDSKFAKDDDVLPDGTVVRRGDKVTYHPYAMGRMEKIWGPDCDEFRPERWLKDGLFSPESPYRYPVFQAGVRVCLGKEMALVAMKTVAISIIQRFDVRFVGPGRAPRFVPGLTATLSGGLPVVIRRRGSSS